jgi:hypothetical protein
VRISSPSTSDPPKFSIRDPSAEGSFCVPKKCLTPYRGSIILTCMETTTVTITPVTATRWDAKIDKGASLTVSRGGFSTYDDAARWVATAI